jgi:hypothetical protein
MSQTATNTWHGILRDQIHWNPRLLRQATDQLKSNREKFDVAIVGKKD